MRGKATNIYATKNDLYDAMLQCEELADFTYAHVPDAKISKVTVNESVKDIQGFWKPSRNGFIGRSFLLVPKDYMCTPRKINLTAGGERFALYPADVDRCAVLQEGGMFESGTALIAGRLSVTHTDDWSQNCYKALIKHIKKTVC